MGVSLSRHGRQPPCACPHARSRSQGTLLTISSTVAPHPENLGDPRALNQSCLVERGHCCAVTTRQIPRRGGVIPHTLLKRWCQCQHFTGREPRAWPFLMLEACRNVRSSRGQFPFRKISGDGGMVSQCECTSGSWNCALAMAKKEVFYAMYFYHNFFKSCIP